MLNVPKHGTLDSFMVVMNDGKAP